MMQLGSLQALLSSEPPPAQLTTVTINEPIGIHKFHDT